MAEPKAPEENPYEYRKGWKTFRSSGKIPADALVNVTKDAPDSPVTGETPIDPLQKQALTLLANFPQDQRELAREVLKKLGLSENKIGVFIAMSGRADLK